MSSYILNLSTNKPWQSVYTNKEGQAIYRTETEGVAIALRLGTRTIKISKIIASPGSVASHQGEVDTMQDNFAHLAKVEYHNIRKSMITYKGEQTAVSDFFKKKGLGPVQSHRAFIGPDGREYIWKLQSLSCELVLGADSTVVARYHPREIVIIGDGQPAYLEIFAEGREMVDLIVTTLVYVEMLRKDTSESLGIYTY